MRDDESGRNGGLDSMVWCVRGGDAESRWCCVLYESSVAGKRGVRGREGRKRIGVRVGWDWHGGIQGAAEATHQWATVA